MDKIKFSYDWNNKLNGTFFTTIRLANVGKYQVGRTHSVFLSKKKEEILLGKAEIQALHVITINHLNPFICGLDTGYTVEEAQKMLRRMYKNADKEWFNLILYKYIKRIDGAEQ